EAGGAAPLGPARDPPARVADPRPVSARRVVAAERHPDAAAQGAHRNVPERRLLHAGLKRQAFVTQTAHPRELFGPTLAPSHKGGGWVWGPRTSRLAPVPIRRAGSRRG